MKLYKMNKNVLHSGKAYAKGEEIKEGDHGFKEITEAGHADLIFDGEVKPQDPLQGGALDGEPQPQGLVQEPSQEPAASESSEESAEQKKSGRKSR